MEVKLSQTEISQIAAEVVRLLKQDGLTTVAPQASKKETGTEASSREAAMPSKAGAKGKPAAAPAVKSSPKQASGKGADSTAAPAATDADASSNGAGPYTIGAAAKVKGYHPNTIRRAIKSGKLKGKIGKDGKYQIKASDLNAFSI